AKYVQRITSWKDRILCADLYMSENKHVKIICTYIPPRFLRNRQLRNDTVQELFKIIKASTTRDCVLLGDFNSAIDDFHDKYEQPITNLKIFFLTDHQLLSVQSSTSNIFQLRSVAVK